MSDEYVFNVLSSESENKIKINVTGNIDNIFITLFLGKDSYIINTKDVNIMDLNPHPKCKAEVMVPSVSSVATLPRNKIPH